MKCASPVNSFRFVSVTSFALLLCSMAGAADLSTYRGFRFGMTLGAVARHSGMDLSEATVIRQKPAQIGELSWLPLRFSPVDTDPVEQVKFTFYNGQLYRIVVDYAASKTTGLSPDDMINSLSAKFGVASRPGGTVTLGQRLSIDHTDDQLKVLGRWQDDATSVDLVQSAYGSNYQLLILSKHLNSLAQTALIEGARLDVAEAPQLEKAKEQAAQSDLAKSRVLNKGNFRP